MYAFVTTTLEMTYILVNAHAIVGDNVLTTSTCLPMFKSYEILDISSLISYAHCPVKTILFSVEEPTDNTKYVGYNCHEHEPKTFSSSQISISHIFYD